MAADPTIPGGRLNRNGIAAICSTNKAYPGVVATATGVHYDTYTITNPSTTTSACATLTLAPACSEGTGQLFCSVYLTAFNPANLATGYRSDIGLSPTTDPASMNVLVSPREVLVVVISGVAATSACSSYSLTVSAPVALPVRASRTTGQPTLTAYPNPVQDVLHIASSKAGGYSLYTTTGELVKHISGSEVSLRDLPGGVYILQQDDTRAATRIVKL
ncbi:hypothetical protein GCM10022406_07820 [Hymenobacter algoricola]|uniref:Secretion system C-terminal sorting domain-containing protein n=1 Tax=Hymenobacter algoricola TaxID=486267 RepID=A0ABP7MLV1_9BACT